MLLEMGGKESVKYFILRQHSFFLERFRLNGWQEKINPKWICFQDFHKVPRRCILTVSLGENIPFPDIVTTPFLLLSSLMMEMVELYGEPVYTRDIVVINEQGKQSRHYHLALPENVEHGHILWEESNMFYMDIKGKKEIVISQDFAESILRRGAVGIMLEEIDLRKELLYGK